jgi:hypothetical protein
MNVLPRRVIFNWGGCCGQGLGDVVRGMIVMHQFCQRIGVRLEVEMVGNVLCEYLEYETPHETHAEFERCKGQKIDMRNCAAWPQDFGELLRMAMNRHTLVIFTNYIPFMKPDEACVDFMRNLLRLRSAYRMQPPSAPYRLVHLRVGDFFMLDDAHPHKNNPDCKIAWGVTESPTTILQKFMHAHPHLALHPGDVVITDCSMLKPALRESFPGIDLPGPADKEHSGCHSAPAAHLGYERDPARLLPTIHDMQLITHASEVVSYSAYPRPSNFVQWLCTCYGVPMTCYNV